MKITVILYSNLTFYLLIKPYPGTGILIVTGVPPWLIQERHVGIRLLSNPEDVHTSNSDNTDIDSGNNGYIYY